MVEAAGASVKQEAPSRGWGGYLPLSALVV